MAAEVSPASTQPAAGGRRLGLGRLEIGFVAVALAAAVAGTAAAQGGFFPTSWGWTALAFAFVAGVAVMVLDRVELGRVELLYLGLVAAFLGWIALSLAWSTGVSATVEEVERTLVYATGVLAFLVVARPGRIRVLLGAVLVGLTGIAVYALVTRLFPASLSIDEIAGYRLSTPIGYYNGLGVLCAIALLLAVGFVAEGTHVVARGIAGGFVPILAATLYFTFSRGAVGALAIAVLFTILVSPTRLRFVTTILVLAVPTIVAVLLARDSFGLTNADATLSAAQHDGRWLALWLLLLGIASAAVAVGLHFAERRPISPRVRQVYATVLVAIAACAVLVGLIVGGGPVKIAHRAYDKFAAEPVVGQDLNERLTQLSGSWRVDFWRVSWRNQFEPHPLSGTGAGTFESYWYQHRGDSAQSVRDPHSLYIGTLGDLGAPGLLLLLAMVLVPFAGLSARRRPFVAIGIGAYALLLVHAGTDWDWRLPAVMLAGTWCGLAALVERRADGPVELGLGGRGAVFAVAAVFGAFAFVALVGNLAVSSTTHALQDGDFRKAAHDARRATGWAPWAAYPWYLRAQTELGLRQPQAAVAAAREAVDHAPNDYRMWQLLAAVTEGPEHLQAVRRANELYPGSTSP